MVSLLHLIEQDKLWRTPFKLLFIACLTLFPLFLLTQRGWVSALGYLGGISALVLLISDKDVSYKNFKNHANIAKLALVFCLPILAVGISQTIRQQWASNAYEGAFRILLAAPMFWVIAEQKVVKDRLLFVKALGYLLPAMLYITLVYITFKPYTKWAANRITTYFVDPLTFGSFCLTAGLLALATVHLTGKDKPYLVAYKLLAFPVAIYLSLLSGSRTGWVALPFVLILFFVTRSGIKISPKNLLIVFITSVLASYLFLSFNQAFYSNMLLAVKDITDYHWDAMNLETPVGMRVSDLRMGIFYFMQNPLAGWGDKGFEHLVNAPEISVYANQFTREFAFKHGFHNEITTNMVRSGIWGLVSSIALFLLPFVFFIKQMKSPDKQTKKIAVMATGYMICVISNSMTTEVLNIKFTASIFALLMAVFVGTLLQNTPSKLKLNDNHNETN